VRKTRANNISHINSHFNQFACNLRGCNNFCPTTTQRPRLGGENSLYFAHDCRGNGGILRGLPTHFCCIQCELFAYLNGSGLAASKLHEWLNEFEWTRCTGKNVQNQNTSHTNQNKTNSLAVPHVAAEFFTSLFSGHRHQPQNREHFNATQNRGLCEGVRGNGKQMGDIYLGVFEKIYAAEWKETESHSGLKVC